jgi:membrane protein DedA with SNARE-associated domain
MGLALLQRWHYVGLLLALLAEEAGIPLPVPGDLLIAAVGAGGRAGHANFIVTTIIVMIAVVGGSAILFATSRRVGQAVLLRAGRRFGFDAERAVKVEAWLKRYGSGAIVVGRLIPGLRIVLTVVAGALGVGWPQFLVGTACAAVLWSAIYYSVGYVLGAGVAAALQGVVGRVVSAPDTVGIVVMVAGLAVAGVTATVVVRRRRLSRMSQR